MSREKEMKGLTEAQKAQVQYVYHLAQEFLNVLNGHESEVGEEIAALCIALSHVGRANGIPQPALLRSVEKALVGAAKDAEMLDIEEATEEASGLIFTDLN